MEVKKRLHWTPPTKVVDDANGSEETSVVAGTLRNVLNRTLKLFSSEHSNRLFSKKMLTKVISKSQIHDVSEHYSAIKAEAKQYYKKSADIAERKHPSSILKTVGFAAVYITKSIILGGAVFAMYEQSWQRLWFLCPPPPHASALVSASSEENARHDHPLVSISPAYYLHVVYPAVLSTVSGMLAGAFHGGLYYALKRFVDRPISQLHVGKVISIEGNGMIATSKPLPKLLSAMFSHSLVYGTLFGVYDFTKHSSLYALRHCFSDLDISSEIEGIISVIIGASVAGIASEMVNTVTHPLETEQLRSLFLHRCTESSSRLKVKQQFRPSYFRGLLPTIGSTVAGFLAYEYAKQFLDTYTAVSESGEES